MDDLLAKLPLDEAAIEEAAKEHLATFRPSIDDMFNNAKCTLCGRAMHTHKLTTDDGLICQP